MKTSCFLKKLKNNIINSQSSQLTSKTLLFTVSIPLVIFENYNLLVLHLLLDTAHHLGVFHVRMADNGLMLASQHQHIVQRHAVTNTALHFLGKQQVILQIASRSNSYLS